MEKRREQLDIYLKNVIQLLGKNPPQELAAFLDLPDYEILFMLRKLAADIFEKGDRYIETGDAYSISPYQVRSTYSNKKLELVFVNKYYIVSLDISTLTLCFQF